MHLKVLVAVLLISQVAAGQDVQVRPLDNGQLEIMVTAGTILDIATAQRLLLPRAIEACAGVRPVLGRYRFESQAPVRADTDGNQPTTYRFVQEVSCGPVQSSSVSESETGVRRENLVQGLEDFIRAISIQYLNDLSKGNFEAAHAALSSEMKTYETFEEWSGKARAFNEGSGPIRSATVWRITV